MTDAEIQAYADSWKVDRTDWDFGAWDSEPDAVFMICEGFRCLIMRSSTSGSFCGYVAVDPTHPWYKVDYDSIGADVHGGLTYSSHDMCRTAGGFDKWWIGFDCSHAGDLSPGLQARLNSVGVRFPGAAATYCDLEYAKREVASLARQAAQIQPAPVEPVAVEVPIAPYEPLDLDHEIAALEKVLEQ